ncbi:MAG: ATP-binding protein, partial [Gammaproteobacteria bacterium]|nr:ATP-binding protein [Gammaproteobacteria bacterium]
MEDRMQRKIALQVKSDRVIELFARDIYQSPMSLLRENVQNAYDAILMRRRTDADFEPMIDVQIESDRITVRDNGNGMTPTELEENYWYAGNSGKNTEEARNAGVVGTFGIGAMANFGIAERLVVETESAATGVRSRSSVAKADLSINQDCIDLTPLDPSGEAGTIVTAYLDADNRVDVDTGQSYIADFVSLLAVPVFVNGSNQSGRDASSLVAPPGTSWQQEGSESGARLVADVRFAVTQTGLVWIHLRNIVWSGREMVGSMTLRSDFIGRRTFRNGFGLATVTAATAYELGGIVDLMELAPTAGREALTTESMQLIQSMLVEVDEVISRLLAPRPECDASTSFMRWVVDHSKYELCDRLKIATQSEDDRLELAFVRSDSERKYRTYAGGDRRLISQLVNEESPLLLYARYDPRRSCEREYIARFCVDHVSEIVDEPQVTELLASDEAAERAILFRVEYVLKNDYLLACDVRFGHISHGIPVFVESADPKIMITVERDLNAVELMASLFDNEYAAFGAMVADFVRSVVYQRVANYVPSSQTHGTEAFLKMVRKNREPFEYERGDIEEFPELAFWDDVRNHRMGVAEAIERTMGVSRRDVQVLDSTSAATMGEVLPDVAANQAAIGATQNGGEAMLEPLPAISRSDVNCTAKLLTIPESESDLAGYRCFLALGEKARRDRAEFFLQAHTTSIVWGGQRVLFVFGHRSGEFGLYY